MFENLPNSGPIRENHLKGKQMAKSNEFNKKSSSPPTFFKAQSEQDEAFAGRNTRRGMLGPHDGENKINISATLEARRFHCNNNIVDRCSCLLKTKPKVW